jgi:Flp pilus assembly pilin Flp
MAFVSKMVRRVREQKGQSMTEYALILAAIAVAAFVAYNALGGAIVTLLGDIQANL